MAWIADPLQPEPSRALFQILDIPYNLSIDKDRMALIRGLQPDDDLKAVLNLCKDFFAEYEGFHREFFATDNLSDEDISGRFKQSMEVEDSATFIALVDGKIVGYALVAVREQPHFYKIRKTGAISGLMVAKMHRRKGIATQLLAEARAYFERQGVKYFTVYTAVGNQAAVKLYGNNGLNPLHLTFVGKS